MKITKIENPREIMTLYDDFHIYSNHSILYIEGKPSYRYEIEAEQGDDLEYVEMIKDKFANSTSVEQIKLYEDYIANLTTLSNEK